MRAVQLLRGSPRRRAVAGFAAAITVLTSFFIVQGFAGATTTTAPTNHLLAVGPTDPDNGFPVWYKDSNNVNLGVCLDDTNPFCGLAGTVPDPNQPVSFPDNFPDEMFYQLANSTIALPNGTTAVLDNNLEAAFNTAAPQAGQQITFGRVRIRITTPTTGHYVVTHPYGVDEFDVTDAATRNINFTEDVGIGSPGDFTGALGSRINPFLRWDTGLVKGPDGASYLGDAATPHAITGSELGTNFFRIDGPDIGGTGINTIQTNLFTVQGRLSTNNGVAPTSVTYTRTTTNGGFIDAFARSEPNQVIQVSGTGVAGTTLKGDAKGNYFARAAYTGVDPPATVNVTNTSDRPAATVKVTVTDQVALTKVTYDAGLGNLKVSATSSDTAVAPTLTAVGFGPLTAGNGTYQLGADTLPPAFVTVTSSKGGTDTAPVTVTGAAFPADPVTAVAPPTLTVQQGQTVQLDGSGSLNATGFSWAQVAGDPVTLTNANTAIASFTAPSTATTLTFRLTVQGPGGPQTTDTVVTVEAVAPPVANAGAAQTVLVGDTVTLDGSASTGGTNFSWAQTGGVPVTLSSTTAAKPTFKMPNTTDPLIFQLTVTGPGGTDIASVQVNPKPDVLTTTRVEYRTGTGEWRVEGTTQVVTGNTITVHIGNTLAGTKLGTPASPDALGAWSVRLVGPPPDGTRTVSIESTRGGILLGVPVNVRN